MVCPKCVSNDTNDDMTPVIDDNDYLTFSGICNTCKCKFTEKYYYIYECTDY